MGRGTSTLSRSPGDPFLAKAPDAGRFSEDNGPRGEAGMCSTSRPHIHEHPTDAPHGKDCAVEDRHVNALRLDAESSHGLLLNHGHDLIRCEEEHYDCPANPQGPCANSETRQDTRNSEHHPRTNTAIAALFGECGIASPLQHTATLRNGIFGECLRICMRSPSKLVEYVLHDQDTNAVASDVSVH